MKKDFKWQKDIFNACVDAMATGNIPHLQYTVIQEYDHIGQGEISKEECRRTIFECIVNLLENLTIYY